LDRLEKRGRGRLPPYAAAAVRTDGITAAAEAGMPGAAAVEVPRPRDGERNDRTTDGGGGFPDDQGR